jgi:hypothetical protein
MRDSSRTGTTASNPTFITIQETIMNTTASSRSSLRLLGYAAIAGFTLASHRRPAIFLWLAAIVITALTGCSKENPAAPQMAADGVPGIGSSFIYKVTTQLNHLPVEVSYDTLTVSRTGVKIAGKSDVVEMRQPNRSTQGYDYLYIRHESNGDLSWSNSYGTPLASTDSSFWYIAPIGSHSISRQSITDSGPYTDFPLVTFSSSYNGRETLGVGSASIPSEKTAMTITFWTAGGDSISTVQRYWFAPSVGAFTRMETEDNHGERRELIGYTLKP